MPLYFPRDNFLYDPAPSVRLVDCNLQDGLYAYVQDEHGDVWVAPDGPHIHPKILGAARPVLYAGDLTVQDGEAIDLTNLSGTFQCDDASGLLTVARQLVRQGLVVRANAVRYFPADGSPPCVLE